jgi:WD40 repeat protein
MASRQRARRRWWLAVSLLGATAAPALATDVRKLEDTIAISLFADADRYGQVLQFDPHDDSLVVVGSDAGDVALVDLRAAAVAWRAHVGRHGDDSVAFSHDGRVIATADGEELAVLDAYSGQVLQHFPVTVTPYAPPVPYSIGAPERYRFSRNDDLMLVASSRQLVVADRATGRAVQAFWDLDETILWDRKKDVQFSPDERFAYLITSSALYVLNIATGELVRNVDLLSALGLPAGELPSVVRITADGAYSTVASHLFVYVIDNQAQRLVRRILAASARINDLMFTDDQCCVITASQDGTSRIYDIATGEQVTRLDDSRPSNERVGLTAAASPRKLDTVVTTDTMGLLRVWRP